MSRPVTTEFHRIQSIERILSEGAPESRAVRIGIGDDAAVLRGSGLLVWTVDAQVEGVHFDRRWVDLQSIGYRSFQAAISDLAAMGARPLGALANLTLPKGFSDGELEELVRGQAEAARECRCPLVGGNLTRGRGLSITTTGLGQARKPLLRSSARAGDELWLIGELGLAALGLRALSEGARKTSSIQRCIECWRRPRALLREGQKLIGRARAAIDISDGLSGDAAHLAASSGVKIVIDQALLESALSSDLIDAARRLAVEPLEAALSGGEDYALLAVGPRARRVSGARRIGYVEPGRGVALQCRSGDLRDLGRGFDHFSAPRLRRR